MDRFIIDNFRSQVFNYFLPESAKSYVIMISPASRSAIFLLRVSLASTTASTNMKSSTTKLILLTSPQSSKDDWARTRNSLIITKVTEQ